MSNTSTEHGFTFNKLMALATAVIIPALGILVTLIIFGTNMQNNVTSIMADVNMLKTDVKDIHTQIDTIERRQIIYQATHK